MAEFDFYPRLHTIPVPELVSEARIGDYVSHVVSKLLMDLGAAGLNRKSITIRSLTPRLFLFQYESTKSYTENLFNEGLGDDSKAADNKVALRDKKRPGFLRTTGDS